MRRVAWIWLLPLLLVFGQAGQFRHETEHGARAISAASSTSSQDQQRPADAERCGLCLAFAHLSDAACGAAPPPALRSDLRQPLVAVRAHASAERSLPAARNRGPPAA